MMKSEYTKKVFLDHGIDIDQPIENIFGSPVVYTDIGSYITTEIYELQREGWKIFSEGFIYITEKSSYPWKSKVAGNQPIAAIKLSDKFWMIMGGTYKAKETIERAGAWYSYVYYCYIFIGTTLNEELLQLVDFVKE